MTEPPPPTLTGKCIQAPALKSVVIATVLVVVPSVTITFWRRAVVVPVDGVQVERARVGRWRSQPHPDLAVVASVGRPPLRPLGALSARTSVVGAAQVARTPCSSVDRRLRRDREVAAVPFQAREVVAVDTVGADPAAACHGS